VLYVYHFYHTNLAIAVILALIRNFLFSYNTIVQVASDYYKYMLAYNPLSPPHNTSYFFHNNAIKRVLK